MRKLIVIILAFGCLLALTGCSPTIAQMSELRETQQVKLQSMGYPNAVFMGRDAWFAPVIEVLDRVNRFAVVAGSCRLDMYVNDGMGTFVWVDFDNGIRKPLYDPTLAKLHNCP